MKDFDWFRDDGVFMPMLNDTARNRFYKSAIESVARDQVVVDIGAGTGMLSVIASRAGAREVIAVERHADRAEYLRQTIAEIGLDNVRVIEADWLDLDIPGDVYVTETLNTQMFGENILQIAQHAQHHPGIFIPGRFEITAAIYPNHPIFVLARQRNESWEFRPDIDIDPVYHGIINTAFQQQHTLSDTVYRANQLNNLFEILPRMPEIRLHKFYESPPLTVDLTQPIDLDSLRITVPLQRIPPRLDVTMVLFWRVHFGEFSLGCNDAWFGNVEKAIPVDRRSGCDPTAWYDNSIRDWRWQF